MVEMNETLDTYTVRCLESYGEGRQIVDELIGPTFDNLDDARAWLRLVQKTKPTARLCKEVWYDCDEEFLDYAREDMRGSGVWLKSVLQMKA